jgi:hypothetical protein
MDAASNQILYACDGNRLVEETWINMCRTKF